MVDPARAALSPGGAVAVGLATLVGGWLPYDPCRLLIERSQLLFGVIADTFVVFVAWALNETARRTRRLHPRRRDDRHDDVGQCVLVTFNFIAANPPNDSERPRNNPTESPGSMSHHENEVVTRNTSAM